jgi:hypothetical protein
MLQLIVGIVLADVGVPACPPQCRAFHGQEHAALVQPGDLIHIGDEMTPRQRQRVDDQALEDRGLLVGDDLVDDSDALAPDVVDGRPLPEGDEGDRRSQVHDRSIGDPRTGGSRARC